MTAATCTYAMPYFRLSDGEILVRHLVVDRGLVSFHLMFWREVMDPSIRGSFALPRD